MTRFWKGRLNARLGQEIKFNYSDDNKLTLKSNDVNFAITSNGKVKIKCMRKVTAG